MSNQSKIKSAQTAIEELKKSGFDAYIVGGAVRDYVMHLEMNDIDITTSAKPFEIMKVFGSAKPTGVKYGTVTVFIDSEGVEITTYRKDGEYTDNRHPNTVFFGESVYDDVQRRDFTINGLLMDIDLKVLDFVDGKADIRNKQIRCIGDPDKRFKEDALRILRAVYFQSKLGFQIEKETRNSMETNRNDILFLSKERVFQELLKILKGKHLKRAFKTMVITNISGLLPGLKKGIEYFAETEDMPFIDVFFTASFALNGSVPEYYPFSNKHRHMYKTASSLANEHLSFDNATLYKYGVEMCLLANKANFILKRSPMQRNKIISDFDNLPIKSELDLALRSTEILKIVNKKAGAWLGELRTELVEMVIRGEIKNDKNELTNIIKARYENA